MSEKSANVIVSLIGVAGLLLYFYFLVMGNVAPENQKYTVIAASVGLLYPIISLSDNEDIKQYGWKVFGIGFAGLCIVLISGFATKVQTSEGIIWNFLNAVTTKGWLYFYLFLLIVANICPLLLKKYSIWVIPFVMGIMIPVLIASLLVLAVFVAGLYLISLYGKSNNTSNSWSSVFGSSSTSNTSYNEGTTKAHKTPKQTKQNNNKKNVTTERNNISDDIGKSWTHGRACFKGRQPSSGMLLGGVNVWYNGSLTQTSVNGGVQIWEGTGDICVAYPRNYKGPKMEFYSSGGTVQIQVC